MKRAKTNYHTLQVLKSAEAKLRNVIISKRKKELLNCKSECVLNVLNGNIKLTGCDRRKLQKYKAALRKVSNRRAHLVSKKKLIVQRGGFLLPLLSEILPTLASLISVTDKIMLRKTYLFLPFVCTAPFHVTGTDGFET